MKVLFWSWYILSQSMLGNTWSSTSRLRLSQNPYREEHSDVHLLPYFPLAKQKLAFNALLMCLPAKKDYATTTKLGIIKTGKEAEDLILKTPFLYIFIYFVIKFVHYAFSGFT